MVDHIAERCYVAPLKSSKKLVHTNSPVGNNTMEFVLDTETTVDDNGYQNLTFGLGGLWINRKLQQLYPFFNEDIVDRTGRTTLDDFWSKYSTPVLTRRDFIKDIFKPLVYDARALYIGYNDRFDLSRIAERVTPSTKYPDGFSFVLSEDTAMPRLLIKSIDSSKAFIEFSNVMRRGSENKYNQYRGEFLDLQTFTKALTTKSLSLEGAAKYFKCSLYKTHPEKHGVITPEYIEYNRNDVLLTHELYEKELEYYKQFRLDIPPSKIFSSASIAKGYLKKRGILPFLEKNPDFPDVHKGILMSEYFGGKTEARIVNEPIPVADLDFNSMYPTVYSLYGMDEYQKAAHIIVRECTEDTRRFAENYTLIDVVNPKIWPLLLKSCEIFAEDDILPVRAPYAGINQPYTIGVNHLKSKGPTVFRTLLDVLAAKLYRGKTPRIIRAYEYVPVGIQEGLQDIEILPGVWVRKDDDSVRAIVERRIPLKAAKKNAQDEEWERLDIEEKHLKTVSNTLSYGITVEINTATCDEHMVKVYGAETYETRVNRKEEPGWAFNPVIGVFMPAGARLILAAAETLVRKNGGYFAYCDTDSVMISPEHAKLVQDFFRPLNPYKVHIANMFKVEEDDDHKELSNVLLYAIASKRYVLYDQNEETGEIKIRKYSSHSLGGLQGLDEKQLWHDILTIHYDKSKKGEVMEKYRNRVATKQLTISTYKVLSRIKTNQGKPYTQQIKPFNFITVGESVGNLKNPKTGEKVIPAVSYKNPKSEEYKYIQYEPFFDYKTGDWYSDENLKDGWLWSKSYWKTLDKIVVDYMNHKEAKSEGDKGELKRRHLVIDYNSIHHIGKETNDIDEVPAIGAGPDNYTEYINWEKIDWKALILSLTPDLAAMAGISRRNLSYLRRALKQGEPLHMLPTTKRKLLKVYERRV